eukprot:1007063-Pelagomonas_calceolata.AAC.1
MLIHSHCTFTFFKAGNTPRGGTHENALRPGFANNHATKDGYTRAIGWSWECTGLALLHVAAKLLLVLLNSAGLAAARRECLRQTQRSDQLHQ